MYRTGVLEEDRGRLVYRVGQKVSRVKWATVYSLRLQISYSVYVQKL